MINKDKYPNGFMHLIMAGHGGVNEKGEYQIIKEGSKQAMVDGKMIYEGEQNRFIRDEILVQSQPMSINVIDIIPETDDIPRSERIQRVNATFHQWKTNGYMAILWELHNNAFNGKVRGTEIYTTTKKNFSDEMATVWWNDGMLKVFPDRKTRPDSGDGDPDKEKNFDIIHKVLCYGVLIEFFFFDNPIEIWKFANPDGYHKWAKTVLMAMQVLDEKYYG